MKFITDELWRAFRATARERPSRAIAIPAARGVLAEAFDFGPDPGNLRMLTYRPAAPLPAGRPLVVVLHGCNQDASTFAADTGWTALADQYGFALLLPEQRRANNQARCFTWFQESDTARGQGEAASIMSMVAAALVQFRADPRRVFLVGLSAGGAMAANLLADHPDRFAAGAIVAGLPVGAAHGVGQALAHMAEAEHGLSAARLADRVRAQAPKGYAGPWPRIAIWHGTADATVDPANARLLAAQWAELCAPGVVPIRDEPVSGAVRERWASVELWTVKNFVHGYPVRTPRAADPSAARYVLSAPISATDVLAASWSLAA